MNSVAQLCLKPILSQPLISSAIQLKPIHIVTQNARLGTMLFWLLGACRLWGQPVYLPAEQPVKPLVINSRFTTMSVNDKVLLYQELAPSKGNLRASQEVIPARFVTSPGPLMIGPAYAHAKVWLYLPLLNVTNQSRQLVVDLEHNRCDTLEAFLLTDPRRQPIYLGKLFRHLPLIQRALPLREFALPFVLPPHASVGLLLSSRRTTGFHQLSVALSSQTYFTLKHQEQVTIRLLALSSALFFTFTVFALGLIFHHRLLVYFGLYLVPVSLGQLNYNYFLEGLSFPPGLGLNVNSIGLFIIFMANTLLHPFGLEYIKTLNLSRPWQRYAVLVLVGANLSQMVLLLFPLTPFTNLVVTQASLVLATINVFWFVYLAVLGFVQKREKYLLVTAALVFGPLLYQTYAQPTPALNYSYFHPFYYLLAFSFLTISLLRRELTSQRLTDQAIQAVHTQLEQLRKSEIELIGRNLHDQLGNTLASALGYLTMRTPRITLARDIILNAINEARIISHNLVKDDERPLGEKLADLAERFNDFSPIRFSYSNFTDQRLDQLPLLKQQGIYLIVQEVLNNIIKHSEAREVSIQSFLSEGVLRVSIDDDGIGYVTPEQSKGIGLANMHKRAELAQLSLIIDSGVHGTSVSIETPLRG